MSRPGRDPDGTWQARIRFPAAMVDRIDEQLVRLNYQSRDDLVLDAVDQLLRQPAPPVDPGYPAGTVVTYTIYDHPSDFPDSFVMRAFLVAAGVEPHPTGDVFTSDSLERVRSWIYLIAPYATCLTRSPGDDPVIVETWF